MNGRELKEYRKNSRLTQDEAAAVLGVSQTYLSLLESDRRRLTEGVKKKLVKKMNVRPTKLPSKTTEYKVSNLSDDQLTADLAALGYKGFSHKRSSQLKNPADVLLSALKSDNRDARLVEALPWLVLKFPDMDWTSLVLTARVHNLQNRLGFVTDVAEQVAESKNDRDTARKLARWKSELELSKLAHEDTLCNEAMTSAERNWLSTRRPDAARDWRLFTDLSPENLRYV